MQAGHLAPPPASCRSTSRSLQDSRLEVRAWFCRWVTVRVLMALPWRYRSEQAHVEPKSDFSRVPANPAGSYWRLTPLGNCICGTEETFISHTRLQNNFPVLSN